LISIAMITMNEEKAVGEVVDKIRKFVPDAEIIIVDSSSDRTPEIAESLGVKVIRQFPPKGYGPAMDLVLRSASGEVIVTMDCDNTYPADRIPDLARYITEEGYDLVDGSRLAKKPKAMPLMNYLANWGFALIASILYLKKITDLHSGMRAYRKTMIDKLKYEAKGAALPVLLLLKPLRLGYKIKFEFIDYFERLGTSTMRPLETSWWTLKRIYQSRFGECGQEEKP
jgi:glycosyltransferase involved in cell wall biosynthesis